MGAGAGDARGDDDRGRQRGRDRPVVAEAPARVLLGRAGGLHARRRRRDDAARRAGGRLLPRRLPVHEPRGVRGDRRARARDRAGRRHLLALRARRRPPAARLADDDRDALAGRLPGDRRLLRQGLPDRRGGRQRLRLARRGDRARLGDLARLLPAGGGAVWMRAPGERDGRRVAAAPAAGDRGRVGGGGRRSRCGRGARTRIAERRRRLVQPEVVGLAVLCAAATMFFGVYPSPLLDLAHGRGRGATNLSEPSRRSPATAVGPGGELRAPRPTRAVPPQDHRPGVR